MDIALELAQQAGEAGEVPVGAIVTDRTGKILGRGSNQRESIQDPTAHAEIVALREAAKTLGSWRLEGCELTVTLEPCPMCLGAIQQARISKVTFGAWDLKGGALSLGYQLQQDGRFHHRFAVQAELKKECSEVLSLFFRERRKKTESTPAE